MPILYWVNAYEPSAATIHRSSCGYCKDGKGPTGGILPHIALNWYGPYASRGAALDVIEAKGWEPYPLKCCPIPYLERD